MPGSKITYVTLLADPGLHPQYEEALRWVEENLLGREYPMYISGEEVRSQAGTFEVRSPFDRRILVGRFQTGTREHARRAIEEAHGFVREWEDYGWEERVRIFRRVADVLEREVYRLAATITYEVGKNRLEALAEVYEAIEAIRYYADLLEENKGYVRKMKPGAPGEETWSVPRPYGAWVVVSPFNFPVMLASGMMMGALLMGNTVVWKPTSSAPLSAILLYKAYIEAGVPPRALHLVTGPGGEFEREFTTNPLVAGIAFTGSREVGMRLYRGLVMNQAYPKPVVLEMGSKNPTIVTNKADVEKAVTGTLRAAFGYSGQKCSATSRVYVQRGIKDRFVPRLVEETRKLRIGDPRKKDTFISPVINPSAVRKFEKAVEEALRAGGRILTGGRVLREGEEYEHGYFVEPTIIEGVPHDHWLWREELFVPLVLIDYFDTLDEALRKANGTEYGLTAGIFSEDPEEVKYFFENIEFGVTYANRRGGSTTGAWPGAQTFVGWKASGATGKGVGGPYYLHNYFREQARTNVVEKTGDPGK